MDTIHYVYSQINKVIDFFKKEVVTEDKYQEESIHVNVIRKQESSDEYNDYEKLRILYNKINNVRHYRRLRCKSIKRNYSIVDKQYSFDPESLIDESIVEDDSVVVNMMNQVNFVYFIK